VTGNHKLLHCHAPGPATDYFTGCLAALAAQPAAMIIMA
jgi:hypothetical protein